MCAPNKGSARRRSPSGTICARPRTSSSPRSVSGSCGGGCSRRACSRISRSGWPARACAWPLGGAVLGLFAPDFVLNRLRDRHMKRLGVELPDALDMMVICAQAGLGLGPMILRVAEELHGSHKGVASEFGQTADELQISTDARVALTRLGELSGVESV